MRISANSIHSLWSTYVCTYAHQKWRSLRKIVDAEVKGISLYLCVTVLHLVESVQHICVLSVACLHTLCSSHAQDELIAMFARLSLPLHSPSVCKGWASQTKQQSVLKSKAHVPKWNQTCWHIQYYNIKNTFNQHLASTTIDAIRRHTSCRTQHMTTHTLLLATVRFIIVFPYTLPLMTLAPVVMAFKMSFKAKSANNRTERHIGRCR